jgi:hypothetical protein
MLAASVAYALLEKEAAQVALKHPKGAFAGKRGSYAYEGVRHRLQKIIIRP